MTVTLRRDGGRRPRPVLGAAPDASPTRPTTPPPLALAARAPRTDAGTAAADEVEQRDLAVYDAAFGISDGQVA